LSRPSKNQDDQINYLDHLDHLHETKDLAANMIKSIREPDQAEKQVANQSMTLQMFHPVAPKYHSPWELHRYLLATGGAMSRRTRKRQSNHVALALTPIIQAYLERIEWALTYGSNIVVFSDDPGAEDHNYVRQVEDHPRPQTLQIGPVSIDEVDQLAAFIRDRIDSSGNPAMKQEQLTTPEFFYPARTLVRSSVDDCSGSNATNG
jgi:hypothetical protein